MLNKKYSKVKKQAHCLKQAGACRHDYYAKVAFFRCSVYTSSQTYYDVLEIGRQADTKEIKKAYIKLCRKVSIEREVN